MNRVAYSSPWIPAEWIAAHGLQPFRLVPHGSRHGSPLRLTAGMCPYMTSFINEAYGARSVSALVLATTCDQMRRAADVSLMRNSTRIPVCLLNIPATWQTPVAAKMYASELRRLSEFLRELGGRPWSDKSLRRAMGEYEKNRASLAPQEENGRFADLTCVATDFHATGRVGRLRRSSARDTLNRVPIGLLGGPLARWDSGIFDTIEEFGGRVVLDGTENGERAMPLPFDIGLMRRDPFGALVRAYFDGMADVFRRPNTQLYDWIRLRVAERGVKGMILLRYLWCDLWHAEAHRIRQTFRVPMLRVDLNGEAPPAATRTRIQAFLESLS